MRSHELVSASSAAHYIPKDTARTDNTRQSPPGDHQQDIIRPLGSEEPQGRDPTHVRPPWKRSTISHQTPNPEGFNTQLLSHLKAPKDSSASQRELASTLPVEPLDDPWLAAELRRTQLRAATPPQSSEELLSEFAQARVPDSVEPLDDLSPETELRRVQPRAASSSGAPKSTRTNQRETTRRLRECQPAAADSAPRPEGQDTSPTVASRPSRDPSSRPEDDSAIRRPPKHPASEHPSPGTFPQPPSPRRRPEGRVSDGGEYVEALRTC